MINVRGRLLAKQLLRSTCQQVKVKSKCQTAKMAALVAGTRLTGACLSTRNSQGNKFANKLAMNGMKYSLGRGRSSLSVIIVRNN